MLRGFGQISRILWEMDLQARLDALLDRTVRLQRVTAHLANAMSLDDVAEIVVDEGSAALGARSAGLWRVEGDALLLIRSLNYPAMLMDQLVRIPLVAGRPTADAVLEQTPIYLTSREDYERRYPAQFARTRDGHALASYANASLPIAVGGVAIGGLSLTFDGDREFGEDERSFLELIALHAAQGFERARLFRAQQAAQERAAFLISASTLLGSSLDYEETLRNVARLAVPTIGSWCGVELVGDDGELRSVAVMHQDPAKIELARTFREKYPPRPDGGGAPMVVRTGKSIMYPLISDEMIAASTTDPEQLAMIRALELSSMIVTPINDRGRTVGAISFVRSDPSRAYTPDDLTMAEQLAERAGAAIGNAMLYEQAQQAIRIRDEFVIIAGHELRTPLAAMSLHHQALAQLPATTPIEKVIERGKKLVGQSDRMARLVEELLDVSRISAGRITLERSELDLAGLVREVEGRMRDTFERANIPLTVRTEALNGSWDRGRLDQVITNLLSNAMKYGRGQPVEVALVEVGGLAVLTVSDRGLGIAPEDQQRIFRRFERAVPHRKISGLGLGLWIAAQLVEAHGGTIGVASTLGEGSTFRVELPR